MKKEKSHSVFGAYMGAVDEVHKKTKPKKNVVDIDFMDSIAGMMQSSTSFLHEKNTADDTAHGTADDTAHGTADDTAHSTRYNRRHSTRYNRRGSNKNNNLEENTAHGTAHGTTDDFIQQTTQHTEQQTTQHTEQQTKLICSVNNPLSLKPIELLTQNQKKVLRSLIDEKGITKLDRLASMSGVKYSGVRVALDALSKRGFISRPKKYIEGIFQGIRYSINNDLCAQLFKQHTEQQTTQHTEQQTTQHTAHGTTVPYNNNSFLIYNIITPQIFEHAEMSFWKEQGLTPEMIQKNIEGSGISEELFVQYMKHYAFKAERGDFKDKEINSHFEYFIGGLKRFSGWTRPNGYISHEEAEKKRLEAFIAEKRKELEELEALKLEAEFLCFYENYIKTPDSEEVKAIMNQATSFDLDNLRRKPDKKETWLRTIWNKSRNMN